MHAWCVSVCVCYVCMCACVCLQLFVHCLEGRSRASSLIIAYLIDSEGFSLVSLSTVFVFM
jgi:hypothetical protein